MPKESVVLVIAVSSLISLAASVAIAQWQGRGMGHDGRWGGGICRMMDVTVESIDPASHSTEEWSGGLERMIKYMRSMGFGDLKAEDKKVILGYLQSQAHN